MQNTLPYQSKTQSSAGWKILSHNFSGQYTIRFAQTSEEVIAAQRLRFEVFNLELGCGLQEAHLFERDEDEYDTACDHLLIVENISEKIVGTYRLLSGFSALAHHDYSSAKEFDLSPFEPYRHEVIELGRACVHKEHRNARVLSALWQGIAFYAEKYQARYLIGCSSLYTQDSYQGMALFNAFPKSAHAVPHFWTHPWSDCECQTYGPLPQAPKIPKLLSAYLSLGAKICAPPAVDRIFKTIDFLTLLDLQNLHPIMARIYLGDSWKSKFDASIA